MKAISIFGIWLGILGILFMTQGEVEVIPLAFLATIATFFVCSLGDHNG